MRARERDKRSLRMIKLNSTFDPGCDTIHAFEINPNSPPEKVYLVVLRKKQTVVSNGRQNGSCIANVFHSLVAGSQYESISRSCGEIIMKACLCWRSLFQFDYRVKCFLSAQKLQGSVWQSTPRNLHIKRPIKYLKLHSTHILPLMRARLFGWLLAKICGWKVDMFQLA